MKGGGPDDYSVPQVMEYYLYRHLMSMLEFYVDHGDVAGGGIGKSIKRKLIKFKDIVGKVAKKIGQRRCPGKDGTQAGRRHTLPELPSPGGMIDQNTESIENSNTPQKQSR
eukprot:COSAG01_NODE_2144_length_8312_cov_22.048843_7_plen_111_part_00